MLSHADDGIVEWARTKGLADNERELHRIYDNATAQLGDDVLSLDDFLAYLPMHSYIFIPSRAMWPAASVDSRLAPIAKMKPHAWLDRYRPVEQMTWAPGEPMLIPDRLIADGGWIDRKGVTCFNLYLPPACKLRDARKAGPWLAHFRLVYNEYTDHSVKWLAHRVQHPGVKINHALVFGGKQGIGKDTILEPVKRAVGPWNFSEVSPLQMLGRFNGFVKSVILRVSEARDLGDAMYDRYQFYEHMKIYTAAPPDVLRCDEKNLREYATLNCCGVVITTNHKADGIYLPADDRRHFVAWSDLAKEDFNVEYWNKLWGWYESGGCEHVAAYLAGLDISSFDPKAPPPQTPAFWDIVDASRAPEDAELSTILERMGNPDAVTLSKLLAHAVGTDFENWLRDRKNRRVIPYRLEQCGYDPIRNDAAKDGLWKIHDARQVVYARAELPFSERMKAARKMTDEMDPF